MVANTDVAPTVLSFLGLGIPDEVSGQPLQSVPGRGGPARTPGSRRPHRHHGALAATGLEILHDSTRCGLHPLRALLALARPAGDPLAAGLVAIGLGFSPGSPAGAVAPRDRLFPSLGRRLDHLSDRSALCLLPAIAPADLPPFLRHHGHYRHGPDARRLIGAFFPLELQPDRGFPFLRHRQRIHGRPDRRRRHGRRSGLHALARAALARAGLRSRAWRCWRS